MYTNPIVAFDGSPLSRRALHKGLEMAKRLKIPLRAVIVDEGASRPLTAGTFETFDAQIVQEAIDREGTWAQKLSQEAMSIAFASGVTVAIEIVEGDVINAIGDAVERYGCDLLIVGLRHHPGLIERLSSHTARSLTERVECSVLGVR